MKRRVFIASAAAAALPARAQPTLVYTRVETPLGAFEIAVDPRVAPITVANYLRYVDAGHLDRGWIYRIVTTANQAPETPHKIQVVQWGVMAGDEKKSPFPPIAHETTRDTGLKHLDGTVSMARAAPGTASSEFFICIGDQPELDYGGRRNPDGQGFAAFGRVVQGMDVVRAIHAKGQPQQFIDPPMRVDRVRRV